MKLDKFIYNLESLPEKGKHDLMVDYYTEDFKVKRVFDILTSFLSDENKRIQFFGLYHLINHFKDYLENASLDLINILIHLLEEESIPITDRAAWAISITKANGVNQLISTYHNTNSQLLKIRIIWSIGRNGNKKHLGRSIIDFLLTEIKSDDTKIKSEALYSLIESFPKISDKKIMTGYYSINLSDFKFYYDDFISIGKSLSKSINWDTEEESFIDKVLAINKNITHQN